MCRHWWQACSDVAIVLGAGLVLMVQVGLALADAPHVDAAGKGMRPATLPTDKVIYMNDIWRPLGDHYNSRIANKEWMIMDNEGQTLYSIPASEKDGYQFVTVGSSCGTVYVRVLDPDIEKRKQDLLLPQIDGRSEERLHVVTYDKVFIQPTMGIVIMYGKDIFDLDPWFGVEVPVATSLRTGKRVDGDFPRDKRVSMEVISRHGWDTIFLMLGPSRGEEDNPLMLVGYDKDLKKVLTETLSRKRQRLQFVRTDVDTIYLATTTSKGGWDVAYFDVKAKKLVGVPGPAIGGTWLDALARGDGRLLVWGEKGISLCEPRVALKQFPRMIEPPESPAPRAFPERMQLLQGAAAVAEDGRFALTAQHRAKRPKDVLVYSREGKLLEQIEMKEGFIEHLKFVSGGKELLVFAREYTARMQLETVPTTGPSTQPATLPHELPPQVK